MDPLSAYGRTIELSKSGRYGLCAKKGSYLCREGPSVSSNSFTVSLATYWLLQFEEAIIGHFFYCFTDPIFLIIAFLHLIREFHLDFREPLDREGKKTHKKRWEDSDREKDRERDRNR